MTRNHPNPPPQKTPEGEVAADDFLQPLPPKPNPLKSVMRRRPNVRLRNPSVVQKPRPKLAKTSFHVEEAQALVGARFTLVNPPHNLVPPGALGIVATYSQLADEIVLMIKWPDGSHDWYLKCEVAACLK